MAEIRCPMCGKPNPDHLESCQHCGARLKPLIVPASPEESQPAQPDPSQDETVSWLRSLGASEISDDQDEEPLDTAEELPDWLQANQEPASEEESPPEPQSEPGGDWLTDIRGSGKLVDSGSLSEEELWRDSEETPSGQTESTEPEPDQDWLEAMRSSEKLVDSGQLTDSGVWPDSDERESPQLEGEEVPEPGQDWLDDMRSGDKLVDSGRLTESGAWSQPDSADQEPETAAQEEELPSWLKPPAEEQKPAPAPEPLPDWLSTMESGEPSPPRAGDEPGTQDDTPKKEATRPIPSTQLPDRSTSDQPESAEKEFDDLPDWLQDSSPAPSPSESAESIDWPDSPDDEETIVLPGSGELIDWSTPESPSEPAELLEIPEVSPDADVPDWLAMLSESKDEVVEEQAEQSPEGVPIAQDGESEDEVAGLGALSLDDEDSLVLEARKGNIPDWLENLQDHAGITTEAEPDLGVEDDALQSWATSDLRFSPEEDTGPGLTAQDLEGELSQGDLPEWVQAMKPVDAVQAGIAAEYTQGEIERVGPLSGLRGLLIAEPDVARPGKSPGHQVALQISAKQRANADLLSSLVEQEASPQPVPRESLLSPQRVLRLLIAAVLLLAVLSPIAANTSLIPLPLMPPETANVAQMINDLEENAPVLLVFDYEPGLSGELDAAAAAVIDHLMLRGARLTLVSSSPIGPALGERTIAVTENQHHYIAGEQYTNLGYIPGSAPGVLNFASVPRQTVFLPYDDQFIWELPFGEQNGWDQPTLQGVEAIKDFMLTIVISDDADTARTWIEQTEPKLRDNSLAMILSAQAGPMVRPYFESQERQVSGMVVGLPGGAAYEQFQGRSMIARNYWDPFGAGIMVAVILILAGGGYNYYLFWNNNRRASRGQAGR